MLPGIIASHCRLPSRAAAASGFGLHPPAAGSVLQMLRQFYSHASPDTAGGAGRTEGRGKNAPE
ncbi:hypothetical protein METH_01495 [Leisingera methylohalidivorans DSM 14336]|uniref:Uncharacterized protein n=1 Tax=Leisingera methylohalidivorans DSM 14336 TaxID=999552 RepID=V9VY16_9RHOB|nr:hypothetical protein METH_01495 [Leisingera methylohalidivorans DSM 14336]